MKTFTFFARRIAALALAAPAFAQAPTIDCSSGPAVPSRVVLAWPSVPSDTSLSTQTSVLVPLVLTNQVPSALDFELVGHMTAGGERAELSLASGTLPPSGTLSFQMPLDGFGIDIASLSFSGSLFVEARVQTTAGELLDRNFSRSIFFHRESSGLTRVYGREARRLLYNSGDLEFSVFTATPASVQGVFDGGKGLGAEDEDTGPRALPNGALDFSAPQRKDGGAWEFCLRWVYQSIDSGFGEDHYTSGTLMKARGMRVVIDHANWEHPREFFASEDNGCFSFVAPENTGFTLRVYAHARLGQNDNLTVKAFPTKFAAQSAPDDPPSWVIAANPGGMPRRVYYQNEASEESNLMAFGSFMLHWIDSQTSPGLPGPANMYLLSDNPNCSGGGSCQYLTTYVQIEPGRTDRKFLVGHEVGHWMHRTWTDDDMGFWDTSWDADSGDVDCAFAGVGLHAMRSKEYAAGGFIEGFAHYLSALAWNTHTQTDGIFKYYKEVTDAAYDDLEADNWRVDLDGIGGDPYGGVTNWMASACFVSDGHSVEMDWLRFYWDYRTNSNTKPSHYEIFRHIQYTRDVNPWLSNFSTYDRLIETIDDMALGQAALVTRFTTLAVTNGVAQ
ncbi:MAG: hypothetical protein ACKVWV_18335 [Planctomycetota bacterium]